jgi:hypothetical protein
VGTTGVANADIRQLVEVVADDAAKLRWLVGHVQEFIDEGGCIGGWGLCIRGGGGRRSVKVSAQGSDSRSWDGCILHGQTQHWPNRAVKVSGRADEMQDLVSASIAEISQQTCLGHHVPGARGWHAWAPTPAVGYLTCCV